MTREDQPDTTTLSLLAFYHGMSLLAAFGRAGRCGIQTVGQLNDTIPIPPDGGRVLSQRIIGCQHQPAQTRWHLPSSGAVVIGCQCMAVPAAGSAVRLRLGTGWRFLTGSSAR